MKVMVHLLCPACNELIYKKKVVHGYIHIWEHVDDPDISLYIINFVINILEEKFIFACVCLYTDLRVWPC